MANRGSNNSILLLTTLGVYIGLVLVGATPVLGHAATTRHFELRDEIEITDDLDNKPDEADSNLAYSVSTYVEDIEFFISGLRNLESLGQFSLAADTFQVAEATQLPCVAGNKVGSYTATAFANKNTAVKPWLEGLSKRLTDGYSLADCLTSNRFDGNEATNSRFLLDLDNGILHVEIDAKKLSKASAMQTLHDLSKAFTVYRENQKVSQVRLRILQNTQIFGKDEQVFVVTRLPRAALDELLFKDAK